MSNKQNIIPLISTNGIWSNEVGFSIYFGRGIMNPACLFCNLSLRIGNIAPLLRSVKWLCEVEGSPILSIFGSLDSIKMSVLSLFYSFLQLPSLFSPLWDIKNLAGASSKCIWMDEKARISLSNLKIRWDRRSLHWLALQNIPSGSAKWRLLAVDWEVDENML